MNRGRLFTWYWRAALDADPQGVTLVRISLGRPKWVPPERTAAIPAMLELAPAGRIFDLEGEAFERAYRERLDRCGVARINAAFERLTAEHGGSPLVLLCFERDRRSCHRALFADWWLEQTGELVDEFAPRP